ncbi:MAG: type II and III secretion system protein family protein [Desulfuromonas sp.]|nr:type II and III secretion system protein family protein [Desulfuromonas sp.]
MMRKSRFSKFSLAVLVCVVSTLLCSLAFAADVNRKTLELKLGGSDLIKTSHTFKRVSIAAPDVADVVVLSPRELYVYGKKVGYTSVILWKEGVGKTLLDVVVSLDLTALKQKIHELYPDQKIEVYGSETGVVLSGTVSGPEVVEQVLRLTQTFLPKQAEDSGGKQGTGRSGPGITNLLQVAGGQQVMLEVKIAEVNRNSTRDWQAALGLNDFGHQFLGNVGVGNLSEGLLAGGYLTALNGSDVVAGSALSHSPGSMLVNLAGINNNVFASFDNISTALEFLETEGLARLLAEPRLVTQSGQEASFLAGGEFPIPVPQGDGDITIDFKEFGVSLVFTPVVLSDGKISLRVAPSVSRITSDSNIRIDEGYFVPNLSTRKLETTVQLYDGQTLALAGLLEDNIRETVRKIPGLGDIPVLGALFRSSEYLQEKTDLLVTVTPHLVKPVKKEDVRYPGEFFQPPNAFQFYLEGRLEGIRRPEAVAVTSDYPFEAVGQSQGGLEGTFGQQPVSAPVSAQQ